MLVDNAFDLVDDSRALRYQMLTEVGELPDLGIVGSSRKNALDAIGTLSALQPLAVVPKECAKGFGIAFIGLVHSGVIGLNDYDFVATGLCEFCK